MGRQANVRWGLVAGVALCLARPAASEVTVALNDGRVDLTARSAPLSDVLDRLARQTQMQVTYDGAPPRHLVTAAVQAATPAQAVLAVLEGLGVNYALQLDATGAQVTTLLLVTTPPPGVPAGRAALPVPSARVPPPPPPDEPDGEPMADEDEPALEGRPERPAERLERMRRGRERPERPGVFDPAAPSEAVPGPGAAPTPAYPVSPFAPVPVLPQIPAQQPPPQAPPQPDPDSF
jgi:hypothetical protein